MRQGSLCKVTHNYSILGVLNTPFNLTLQISPAHISMMGGATREEKMNGETDDWTTIAISVTRRGLIFFYNLSSNSEVNREEGKIKAH